MTDEEMSVLRGQMGRYCGFWAVQLPVSIGYEKLHYFKNLAPASAGNALISARVQCVVKILLPASLHSNMAVYTREQRAVRG